MSEQLADTLSEIVDRFMVRAGIEKRKHAVRYQILAEECWQDVFQNTLWCIKSVWLPTKSGNPYNYVQMPSDCARLLSVANEDKCGLVQPLFYNNQLNVIAKPSTKKCGCSCNCSGLCESVNSTTTTSELLFTISGIGYYRTCWIKYCPNGDTIKWCRTPVKKYNSVTGTPGDYDSEEYNEDYLIGTPPFEDFTIVYVETQEKLCKLETESCGCPKETEENEKLFMDCCGFWTSWNCRNKRKHCKQFSENINDNGQGDIKISDCNSKIFFRPSSRWQNCYKKPIPDYLLVNYQTTGVSCGAETLVPIYARNLMYSLLDSGRKEYNSSYNLSEKQEARHRVVDERQKIISFLNPVSVEFMAGVQNCRVNW